jgi:hypothetical protein
MLKCACCPQTAASNSEAGYNLPRQVKAQVVALLEEAAGAQGAAAAGECSALLRECLYQRPNGQDSLDLDDVGMAAAQALAVAKWVRLLAIAGTQCCLLPGACLACCCLSRRAGCWWCCQKRHTAAADSC